MSINIESLRAAWAEQLVFSGDFEWGKRNYVSLDFFTEYFQQLFESITPYFSHTSEVLMILSEDCDLKQIRLLAKERKLQLKQKHIFKKWGELNYLFTLESI